MSVEMRGSDEDKDLGATTVCFRIDRTDPPTLRDFLSNEAKGRQLRHPTREHLRRWSGVSAYLTAEAARATAIQFPRLGHFIARLNIQSSAQIHAELWPDSEDGHLTLWGEPADLLNCVVSILPLDAVE